MEEKRFPICSATCTQNVEEVIILSIMFLLEKILKQLELLRKDLKK